MSLQPPDESVGIYGRGTAAEQNRRQKKFVMTAIKWCARINTYALIKPSIFKGAAVYRHTVFIGTKQRSNSQYQT